MRKTKAFIFAVAFLTGLLFFALSAMAQEYQRIVRYMPDGITVMHDNLNARDSLLAPICDLIVLPHGCKASLDTSEMIDTLPILSVFGVKMLPVIINPDSSKSINYSATFTSATIEEVYEMPLNEHKINLIKSLVVNPNTVSSTLRKISIDTNVPEGYLIITHKQFNKAASQLAHNKRLLGYNVKICSGENWTPYKIRQCVKKVCREIPNITYLCLLGGYAHLPAYFSDVGQMSERPYPTDQFFGCINDSLSLFPDIQIGRISVIDPQTALNVVQKLADYEFEPNFPERFYNTATYATYFEGVAPDYEKEGPLSVNILNEMLCILQIIIMVMYNGFIVLILFPILNIGKVEQKYLNICVDQISNGIRQG